MIRIPSSNTQDSIKKVVPNIRGNLATWGKQRWAELCRDLASRGSALEKLDLNHPWRIHGTGTVGIFMCAFSWFFGGKCRSSYQTIHGSYGKWMSDVSFLAFLFWSQEFFLESMALVLVMYLGFYDTRSSSLPTPGYAPEQWTKTEINIKQIHIFRCLYMGVPKIRVPQNGWFIMENPI